MLMVTRLTAVLLCCVSHKLPSKATRLQSLRHNTNNLLCILVIPLYVGVLDDQIFNFLIIYSTASLIAGLC